MQLKLQGYREQYRIHNFGWHSLFYVSLAISFVLLGLLRFLPGAHWIEIYYGIMAFSSSVMVVLVWRPRNSLLYMYDNTKISFAGFGRVAEPVKYRWLPGHFLKRLMYIYEYPPRFNEILFNTNLDDFRLRLIESVEHCLRGASCSILDDLTYRYDLSLSIPFSIDIDGTRSWLQRRLFLMSLVYAIAALAGLSGLLFLSSKLGFIQMSLNVNVYQAVYIVAGVFTTNGTGQFVPENTAAIVFITFCYFVVLTILNVVLGMYMVSIDFYLDRIMSPIKLFEQHVNNESRIIKDALMTGYNSPYFISLKSQVDRCLEGSGMKLELLRSYSAILQEVIDYNSEKKAARKESLCQVLFDYFGGSR